jgi:hypothetical protein
MSQTITANGQELEFRGVSSNKDLAVALADGFASVVGWTEYPREGKTTLIDVAYSTKDFGAVSRMLMSRATARKLNVFTAPELAN